MAKTTSKKVLNNVIAEETKATPKAKGIKKSANKAPDLTKATIFKFGEFCGEYAKGEKKNVTAELWESFGEIEPLENVRETAYKCYIAVKSAIQARTSQGTKEDSKTGLDEYENLVREYMGAWFRLLGVRPSDKKGGKNRPLYKVRETDFATLGETFVNCKGENEIETAENVFYALIELGGRMVNGEELTVLTENELKTSKKERKAEQKKRAQHTREQNKANTQEIDMVKLSELVVYATENLSAEQAEQLINWAKENAETIKIKPKKQ